MAAIRTKIIRFFILVAVISLASCVDKNTVYDQYLSIPSSGWHEDSVAVFCVDIADTIDSYNVILGIRNRNEYPYQNLYLFVNSQSPDSISVSDTLNCILADNQGRWLGSGIGSTSDLKIEYMLGIKFPRKGIYTFEIKQGMRETVLQGISDVGLEIEKSAGDGEK